MCNSNVRQPNAANDEIYYYVVSSDDNTKPRSFGIQAVLIGDHADCETAENLFFTQLEAEECCHWLAENFVYPITLCEVLENFYNF